MVIPNKKNVIVGIIYLHPSSSISVQQFNSEGFFKEIPINESNGYERNFKNFNEREFQETLSGVNWDTVLSLDNNDPNLSIDNFYNHLNLLLDDFAPYKETLEKGD